MKGNIISLRPITLSEVNLSYLSWLEDPEVMQGIATSGYTLEKLREYVDKRTGNPSVAFFAIWANDSHQHIGNIKLEEQDSQSKVADLGLLIGNKSYWGKGVGKEACQLAIRYGFDQMHLRKIYLAVYENNPAARKLYTNLGFNLEGTLRKHVLVNGVYYDKYLMGLFKEEFVS